MNKKRLTELLAQQANLPHRDASLAVNTLIDLITSSIERGIPVSLRGFGTFSMRERKSRMVHNPATGRTSRINAAMSPHFRPSRTLRNNLHGG